MRVILAMVISAIVRENGRMPPSYRHANPDENPDRTLHEGPADGPDILEGREEDEPSLDDLHLADHHIPLRKPDVGKRLSAKELEADLGE
jgi:hypothetical protein